MTKLLVAILVAFAAGGVAGGFGGSRIAMRAAQATIVPCPACNCPPAAVVDLGALDFGKINNKKGTMEITIDQKFDNVSILLIDTAAYKKALERCK